MINTFRLDTRDLFAKAPIPMVVMDGSCQIQHINHAARQLTSNGRVFEKKPFGAVFRCQNAAHDSGSCGSLSACQGCQIRSAVQRALDEETIIEGKAHFVQQRDAGLHQLQINFTMGPILYNGSSLVLAELNTTHTKGSTKVNESQSPDGPMKQILDRIPADIYAADLETYEILFMNQHMKEKFGGDYTGEVCWKVFRNFNQPCPLCTNRQLLDKSGQPVGVVEWEGFNPISNTWYLNQDRAILWENGKYVRLQIATDISERKKTEEGLRRSQEKFTSAFQGGPLMTAINDLQTGEFLEVNQNFIRGLGYSQEMCLGKTPMDLGMITDADFQRILKELERFQKVNALNLEVTKADGKVLSCRFFGEKFRSNGSPQLLIIIEDITHQRKIWRKKEETYQGLSLVNQFVTQARELESPRKLCQLAAKLIHQVNQESMVVLSRYDHQGKGIRLQAVEGIPGKLLQKVIEFAGIDLNQILVTDEELGKLSQEESESGLFLSGKIEKVEGGIRELSFGTISPPVSKLIEKSLKIDEIYSVGFSRDELPRGGVMILVPPGAEVQQGSAIETIANHLSVMLEDIQYRNEILRKQQEEKTLREVGMLVTQSVNRQNITQQILDQLKKIIPYDSASIQLIRGDQIEIKAVGGEKASPEQVGKTFSFKDHQIIQKILLEVESIVVDDVQQVTKWIQFPGDEQARSWMGVPLIAQGNHLGVLTVAQQQVGRYSERDLSLVASFANQAAITLENNQLFHEAQKRLNHLSSLRSIDQTISGSLDIHLTLKVLLDQLLSQLNVDAAAIYLYDQVWQTLDFAVARGFSSLIQQEMLSLEDSLIRKAVLKNQSIFVENLNNLEGEHDRKKIFQQENFQVYFCLPLSAKGEIVGILEVFNRDQIQPDPEWQEFLEALAGQAGIAIDRLNMYLKLKQTNMELVQAYDATIAGLARVLELRDMETQGHSQRVVELMLALARKMGLENDQFTNIRRGALLHDIGKMGIPDHILHKPGKLTEEEWQIMRLHPVYAYQMLAPIEYLKDALDIPYYHHERWDGAGYPEGLSGAEIPLTARMFAVVDVWDALRSDRPYRKAWDDARALEHIREQAGSQFDPEVVGKFLDLIEEFPQSGFVLDQV